MKTLIIATTKSWNLEAAAVFSWQNRGYDVRIIDSPSDLTPGAAKSIAPDWIFFPHWSWIVPREIHEQYRCVVFHMTDLPYGRGGSPLQNLIVRGHRFTRISAIQMTEELDGGPVYLKKELSLAGTAEEILRRASQIIFDEMIPAIVRHKLVPEPQHGKVVQFERRKPSDGCIDKLTDLHQIYDYIRMLDAEGYPPAFIQCGNVRVEFAQAEVGEGRVEAKATIKVVDHE